MEFRNLGKTKLSTSILGMGCSSFLSRANKKESEIAIGLAREAGINFFDTAPIYGQGDSERLLGKILRSQRNQILLSTKIGISIDEDIRLLMRLKPFVSPFLRPWRGLRKQIGSYLWSKTKTDAYSNEQSQTSLDESLKRLSTSYVDILFLHSPSLSILMEGTCFENLQKAKQSGKARFIGLSCNHVEEALFAITHWGSYLDVLQLPYGKLTEDAQVMEKVLLLNLGIVIREPFQGGKIFENVPKKAQEEIAKHRLQLIAKNSQFATILASQTNPEHLRINLSALEKPGRAKSFTL